MSGDNPFGVSKSAYGDRSESDRDTMVAEVTTRTIDMLNQTRPWVQLIGVLMWIGTVLLGVFGALSIFGALLTQNLAMILIAVLYIIITLIYASLARSLTTYSGRISQLRVSEKVRDLEDALEAQKNFWRLAGIITLVTLLAYLVILVLVISGAAFLGNGFRGF